MTMIKVAINGFGRIGRMVLRAHYEGGKKHDLQFVAVNDLGDAQTNAHLLKYDTAHGPFPSQRCASTATASSSTTTASRWSPSAIRPSCPGRRSASTWCSSAPACSPARRRPARICAAGAKKVIISAPGDKDVDRTVVYGREPQPPEGERHGDLQRLVHHQLPGAARQGASTTASAWSSGLMTTIHSFTNDQVLTDVFHKDLRRARSATHNMIPTKTGAAAAVGLVLPHLNGKLDGYSIRVPTINVSIVDLTFVAKKPTTVDEVNKAVKQACDGDLKGILEYNTEPLVSSDFNHNPASSIFDSTLTRVSDGTLVKVSSWYDNEWGFSNRMLDVAVALSREVGAALAK